MNKRIETFTDFSFWSKTASMEGVKKEKREKIIREEKCGKVEKRKKCVCVCVCLCVCLSNRSVCCFIGKSQKHRKENRMTSN